MMEYRNVTVDPDGSIHGEQRNPSISGTWKLTDAETGVVTEVEVGGWGLFSAEKRLWTIREALDRFPQYLDGPIWDLQDGYGEAGFTPVQGWDWSGIRDSSEEAKDAMFALASEFLTEDEVEKILGVRWTS